jgi:hypothetical protein
MPDPAKSVGDIDDVLSSIRRLVAEQPGAARADANRGADAAPRPAGEDRLVLTPALRVTDADGPARASIPAAVDDGGTADAAEAVETMPETADAAPEAAESMPETADAAPEAAETMPTPADDTPETEETTPEHAESMAETAASDAQEDRVESAQHDAQPETAQDPELSVDVTTETPEWHGDAPATDQTDVEPSAQDAGVEMADTASENQTEAAETWEAVSEVLTAPSEEPHQLTPHEPAPEASASAPANEAGRPLLFDTRREAEDEGAEEGVLAHDDAPGTDSADATDEPRVIGNDGWRPEMRLFDWSASVQTEAAAPVGLANGGDQFESETGDANWPDETADRAVLDLAAVRETAEIGTAADADNQGDPITETTVAGFTPIFSRRATEPATRAPSPAADAEAETEEPAPTSPFLSESAGDAPADDLPESPVDEIADMGAVHDITAAEPVTEDSAADGADMEPGMAGADTMAFSSIRETGADHSAEVSSPDPDDIDTAALLDDLPPVAATPDVGDSTASGARLTVLVGKGDPVDPEPAADASPQDAVEAAAPDAADLRSIDTRILEEEVLRRIVAEAVREELQGALGERITRNVRKLVRREIRLVLAVDELD